MTDKEILLRRIILDTAPDGRNCPSFYGLCDSCTDNKCSNCWSEALDKFLESEQ